MRLVIKLGKRVLDALVGYGKEVVSYVKTSGIPTLIASKPFSQLVDALDKLEKGYMKIRKNTYTLQLIQLDDERDDCYRSLYYVVKGCALSNNPAEVQAARQVIALFERYGLEFLQFAYVTESARMSNFIAELKLPRYAEALILLTIGTKLAKLEEADKAFNDCYALSVEDIVARKEHEAASAVRKEFQEALEKFMIYLEGKSMEETDPKWEALCQKIESFNTRFGQNADLHKDGKEDKSI